MNQKIQTICEQIDGNIKHFKNSDYQLLAQNVIKSLRDLVEHVALKIYSEGNDVEVSYDRIQDAIRDLKSKNRHRWLIKFHKSLQESVSHYTLDGENAYRLMHKYYAMLLKIRKFLYQKYQLNVLEKLEYFPIHQDADSQRYFEKVAKKINTYTLGKPSNNYNDRYYIQSVKPFFIRREIYYQISFTAAHNNISKFDRIIAFTKLDIPSNYAVKLKIHSDEIEVFNGIKIPVQIIDGYEISIRPCEIDNFAKIFRVDIDSNKKPKERGELMRYLTTSGNNLLDLIDMEETHYQQVEQRILQNITPEFFNILNECRTIIRKNSASSNILRYLLFTMNNKIIKQQYSSNPCERLSNLNLKYGCIPFDEMPFCTSLMGHNPRILDLFECLDNEGREHEHLARIINNNTEINCELYTSEDELNRFDNFKEFINGYNGKLYWKHKDTRKLVYERQHLHLQSYETDTIEVIKRLQKLACNGIPNYKNSVDIYLKNYNNVECPEKKQILKQAFIKSKVIALYGSAGTGKTKFIEHLSDFFIERKIHFLANTNSAVNNLKRRIFVPKGTFKTIEGYKNQQDKDSYLLIIDECSTVSNTDMRAILDKSSFQLLVLVGDIYQIESIRFGNWFGFAKQALPGHCIFELTTPYRTKDTKLLELWGKVRKGNDSLAEFIAKNDYSSNLTEEFYQSGVQPEGIILCLNYGGLYGVNNINSFLQANNPESPFEWETKTYKVGDPILFNESKRFSPLIYNNCKGVIKRIDIQGEKKEQKIIFDIVVEVSINEINAANHDFELLPSSEEGALIRFSVSKRNTDNDDDSFGNVPFNVAYAVSIHKAQGLEYDSVKVVISDDTEEQISHNIFYTAITRAKKDLKIYWTEDTQERILSRIKPIDNRKDWHLLSQKI